ncbi:MAG: hypothetical protein RPS47_07565 [Colwellia sp.]|jgi:hypothetical protein
MRNLFIISVITGLPVLYLFTGLPQLVAVATLQLIYYFACKHYKFDQVKTGDSSYYLGFMLTLLALFLSFTPSINNEFSFNADEILGNFGVAISSTILGIFLRIIEVNYYSNDDIDINKANADVTEALRNFSSRIRVIEKDFSDISSSLVKSYSESLGQIKKEGDELISESQTRNQKLKADLDLQRGEIRTSFDSLVNSLEKRSLEYFDQHTKGIEDITSNYQSESNLVIDEKMKYFFDVIESYSGKTNDLFDSFSKISTSTKDFEELSGDLVRHSETMKLSYDNMRNQHEKNLENISTFNSSVEDIKNGGGSITSLFKGLNRTVEELNVRIDQVSSGTQELDKLVQVNMDQEKHLADISLLRDNALKVNKELSNAVVESAGKLLKALS